MIKLYYICSLKSSIFLNFFKLDNQFFCRALKYIILRRKKLDKIILYKFYLILINLIYLLLITVILSNFGELFKEIKKVLLPAKLIFLWRPQAESNCRLIVFDSFALSY